MPNQIIDSERTFQVWKYTVGHCQLLLRSTKSAVFPTRVDVFFKGVSEIHLPTLFDGLSIWEASDSEASSMGRFSQSPDAKNFVVKGKGFSGYVAALTVACHEDEGEYDDPSFFSKNNIL